MKPTVLTLAVVAAAVLAPGTHAQDRDAANYVGLKTCGMCHKKDATGNQFAKWQAGPHAKAYETLASDESKAAAEKLGIADPQKSGKCLKCHSTAYNFTEEVQTDKIEVASGVTCQSCHGPGKKYKSKTVMQDRQKCIENGMVHPATESCALCHNEESPFWNPERYTTKDGKKVGFDAEQAYEEIKHPNPEKAQ